MPSAPSSPQLTSGSMCIYSCMPQHQCALSNSDSMHVQLYAPRTQPRYIPQDIPLHQNPLLRSAHHRVGGCITWIPHGYRMDTLRIPYGYRMDTTRIPYGYHIHIHIWNRMDTVWILYGLTSSFSCAVPSASLRPSKPHTFSHHFTLKSRTTFLPSFCFLLPMLFGHPHHRFCHCPPPHTQHQTPMTWARRTSCHQSGASLRIPLPSPPVTRA